MLRSIRKLIRSTPGEVKLRSAPSGSDSIGILEGYAARFNSESCILWDPEVCDGDGEPMPFIEVLDPTCFNLSLETTPDVVALYNHNTDAVLGRTTAGTLDLAVDELGLRFLDHLPNTTYGNNARVSVGRGDIKGCSFGFCLADCIDTYRTGLPMLRRVMVADLFEVTIATAFPAYETTTTQVRALERLRAQSSPKPKSSTRARHMLRRRQLDLLLED
jgi:HK97 family phage prohead protease